MSDEYLQIAGSFECFVINPEGGWFGESAKKGTPFVRIAVEVADGPEKGKMAVWAGWLTEGAQDGTLQRLVDVFGFDGDLHSLNDGVLTGRPCNITTEMETYEGKTRCKVAYLNPPGGGGAKPMDKSKVNALIARLNTRARAIAKQGAPKTAAQLARAVVPQPAQVPDDDVPF